MQTVNSVIVFPLVVTAILLILIAVFFIIGHIRKTRKINIIYYFELGIFLCGTIYTIIKPESQSLVLTFLIGIFILFIYSISIAFSKYSKDQDIYNKDKENPNMSESKETQKNIITNLSNDEIKLFDVNKEFILRAISSFSMNNGLETLLNYINEKITTLTNANGGAILIMDDFEDEISVKSFSGDFPPPYKLSDIIPHKKPHIEANFRHAIFPLSGNIFGDIATNGNAEIISNPQNDTRIIINGPEDILNSSSYIFVPLKINNTVLGLIALSKNKGTTPFSDSEFETAKTLSDFASYAIYSIFSNQEASEHKELSKETDIASNVQKKLIPSKIPLIDSLSIGIFSVLTENVCSDYYDILPYRKNKISFIMTDVAGKGMDALTILIMIRAMLKLIINTKQTTGKILTWINHCIAEETTIDHFASLSLINYDNIKNEIEFSTAGTNPVYYYSFENDIIKKISVTKEPIGVDKNNEYKTILQTVVSGDIIILCTDGILEAQNEKGIQYSEANLMSIIKTNHNSTSNDIVGKVRFDFERFCGNTLQHDNHSLMIIKIK